MNTVDCPRCEHEHDPYGNTEDDSGEWECEKCGFKFEVEVEYEPSYTITCKHHHYGPLGDFKGPGGIKVSGQFCNHCGAFKMESPETSQQ